MFHTPRRTRSRDISFIARRAGDRKVRACVNRRVPVQSTISSSEDN